LATTGANRLIAALVPWRLKHGHNWGSLYLPVAALILHAIYEAAMPPHWDIRLDLVLLTPMGLVIILAWITRLVVRLRGARV